MAGIGNNRPILYCLSSSNCLLPSGKSHLRLWAFTRSRRSSRWKAIRQNSFFLCSRSFRTYIKWMYWSIYIVFFNIVLLIMAFKSLILPQIRVKIHISSKSHLKHSDLWGIGQNIETFLLLQGKNYIKKNSNGLQNLLSESSQNASSWN